MRSQPVRFRTIIVNTVEVKVVDHDEFCSNLSGPAHNINKDWMRKQLREQFETQVRPLRE